MTKPPSPKVLRLFQIFAARLVLEVFGAGGATWGFSEAIGLRTSSTEWFWRPCALIVAAVFFARWIVQLVDYMLDNDIQFLAREGGGEEDEQVSLASKREAVYS